MKTTYLHNSGIVQITECLHSSTVTVEYYNSWNPGHITVWRGTPPTQLLVDEGPTNGPENSQTWPPPVLHLDTEDRLTTRVCAEPALLSLHNWRTEQLEQHDYRVKNVMHGE